MGHGRLSPKVPLDRRWNDGSLEPETAIAQPPVLPQSHDETHATHPLYTPLPPPFFYKYKY